MNSYRDYEDFKYWGIPKLQAFSHMNPASYPSAFSIYKNHEDELIQHCRTNIHGNWCLSICLWGHFEDLAKPTVIVYYTKKSASWVDPIIDNLPFLSIESPIEYYNSFPTYQQVVISSACIGTKTTTGTLGGYLQVCDASDKTLKGKIFGLTCAHVQKVNGEWCSVVEQPSSAAIDSVLSDLEDEASISELKSIEDNSFGKIVDGEIYIETEKHCCFDWVLIDVKSTRIGRNNISLNKYNRCNFENVVVSILQVDGKVWKDGYATGFTTGTVNGVKAHISIDGVESTEWIVIGNRFSLRGDSGAWVSNMHGVCGMVIGGTPENSWTFVTNFDDLLKRINDKTGYQIHPT